jgi:hypothetical protein
MGKPEYGRFIGKIFTDADFARQIRQTKGDPKNLRDLIAKEGLDESELDFVTGGHFGADEKGPNPDKMSAIDTFLALRDLLDIKYSSPKSSH